MLVDFNLKEQFKVWKRAGKPIPKEYFDLGIAFWLLDPDAGDYSPERVAQQYLQTPFSDSEKTRTQLRAYAEKKLKEYKLEKIFWDMEMPLLEILADMELAGIGIDRGYLRALEKELEKRLETLTKAIYKHAGETFNINSPKQLGEILFQRLKIDTQGVKKTKTGKVSTDIDTLLLIQDRHKIIASLLEYRELFKLLSTYIRPLQELADDQGRVHTHYIQTGTATGRLSSQNPNLQNIPIGSEWATKLRTAFVAEKGYRIAAFDYSQIELRILASLTQDPEMMKAFNENVDIHALTASKVFKVAIAKVTPEMRRLGKTLNFGVVYGMGAMAFAKSSGVSFADARKFITEYFNDFKQIKIWQEEIKAQARTYGYVTNLNGRRRIILGAAGMGREVAEGERAAINMPIQSMNADIMKLAVIRIAKELKKSGWYQKEVRLLLTIHDELLFEINEHIIEEATRIITKAMESVYALRVPIKVTKKIGENWGAYE